MPEISLQANLIIIGLVLLFTMTGSFKYCDAAFKSDRDRASQGLLHRWWPLRMSNCLILLSATYYAMNCLQHPPIGSRPDASLCRLVLMLGAVLSAKGY